MVRNHWCVVLPQHATFGPVNIDVIAVVLKATQV